ncbi:hypothetical protein Tco_0375187 [Tanacetum coccineum]
MDTMQVKSKAVNEKKIKKSRKVKENANRQGLSNLWDVIENGNLFKPVPQTTKNADGSSTSLIPCPVTTEEKVQKKNDMKARSMLLTTLSNEHLMTFNQYKDAQTLFAAILEDCNSAGYSGNKPDLDIMSFDDLYNNFKIVEQEVKGIASSSSSLISPASTQVSTTSTQVSTASTQEDGIEEMDLKWQLALLSMRIIRFFQKTGRKITINRSDTAGYDNSRRTVNVEETSSKAMVAINGSGFDWCYMADNEVPTNMPFMAFSDSEIDDLRIEFNKSEFNLATYKRGLASVEEHLRNTMIGVLLHNTCTRVPGSQITDKSKKGVGFVSYNAVPPPPTWLFSPPKFDLSNSGLEEFQQPEFEGYGPKTSKSVSEDIFNKVRESPDAPLVEKLVSDDKLEKKTSFPTVAEIEFVRLKQQEKLVRKPVKYAEMYRSQSPRGCDNHGLSREFLKGYLLKGLITLGEARRGSKTANCNYHQRERAVSRNRHTGVNYNYFAKKAHPSAHRNMVPRAVLTKTGLRSLNTARPVNTTHPKTIVYSARPMSHFSKSAQSTVKRPYQIRTSLTNKNFSQKVNTTKGKIYIARPKAVNTARPNSAVVNDVRENQVNAVKASACWVWRPTKLNSALITSKRHNYVSARGRSKSVMT